MNHYLKTFITPVILLALGILYLGGMAAISPETYSATPIGIAIAKTALGAMGTLALLIALLCLAENPRTVRAVRSR